MRELNGLVRRAQADDLEAYNEIVRRLQDMAVMYAHALLGDFHLAEDAAQESFVAAYLDLHKLQTPEAFVNWFRRIVRNRCGRFTRGRRLVLVPLDEARSEAAGQKGPVELVEERESVELVREAVEKLSEGERSVVALYYAGQFTQRRIAAFLDVPETTVVNRLRSARKTLKKEWIAMTKEKLPSQGEEFADGIQQQVQELRAIHETLCAMMTGLFTEKLARETEIKTIEIDQVTYAEFICPIPDRSMMITFLLKPLEGRLTFDMSYALVYAVLHKGEKLPAETEARWKSDWLTDGEQEELFRPFLEKALRFFLVASWESTLELTFGPGEYESNPAVLLEYPDYPKAPGYKERMDLPKPSDMVFRIRMSVEAGDISEKLLLCYPMRMLESVFKSG